MENDMARNTERDEREATRRKEQLMKAGFKLFSENGIENVSLQKVADAADVGVATMYKYYQTSTVAINQYLSAEKQGRSWLIWSIKSLLTAGNSLFIQHLRTPG